MTVDDLKAYYKTSTDGELAETISVSKGAVSKWRSKGISPKTQAKYEILTKGKLKANLKALTA